LESQTTGTDAPKLSTKVIENESNGIAFAHFDESKKDKKEEASPGNNNMLQMSRKGQYLH